MTISNGMKNERGFTLIEFIMIIAIGSFLVGGIVLFANQLVRNGTQMRDFLVASNLAKLKMAVMNNTGPVPLGTTTLTAEPSFPNYQFRQTVTNVATGSGQILRQVVILVDYTSGNFSTPLVRLITYRKNNTSFGNGI